MLPQWRNVKTMIMHQAFPQNDTLQLGSAMPPCFVPSMDGKGTQDHVELDLT